MDKNQGDENQDNSPAIPSIDIMHSEGSGNPTDKQQRADKYILEQMQNKWREGWKRWKSLEVIEKLTGWLVLFTALYAVITFCQLTTMQKSFRISERAYVAALPPDAPQVDANGPWVILTFENTGKIPADDVRVKTWTALGGGIDKIDSRPSYFPHIHHKLHPGSSRMQIMYHLGLQFDQRLRKVVAEAIEGKETMWIRVEGEVSSGDGFGNREVENFCFRYVVPLTSWVTCPFGSYSEHGMRQGEIQKDQKTPRNYP
jgi:hypothetical protein